MSPHTLKDVLGNIGDFAVKGIKAGHVKLLRWDKRKFKRIHDAVDHFEGKMKERQFDLSGRIKLSTRHTLNISLIGNQIGTQ